MKKVLSFAAIAVFLATAVLSTASAQSDGFSTDPAQWSMDVGGIAFTNIIDEIVLNDAGDTVGNIVVADNGSPFDTTAFLLGDQNLSWGMLTRNSATGNSLGAIVQVPNAEGQAILGSSGTLGVGGQFGDLFGGNTAFATFTVDPALGMVNGFCLRYSGAGGALVRVLDGDNEIATIQTATGEDIDFPFTGNSDVLDRTYICWENENGDNVTSFEISYIQDTGPIGTFLDVLDGEIRFQSPVVEESNFDKLTSVIDRLELLADTLEGNDAWKAHKALHLLDFVHDDDFWELPEGERLSRYGSTVFLGSAYAIAYLNKIDSEEADLLAEDVVCVLEQVVDSEIDYAIENGGRTDFIERAEDIADVAEYIDEECDNDAIAALVYRRAWLFAYCSTY